MSDSALGQQTFHVLEWEENASQKMTPLEQFRSRKEHLGETHGLSPRVGLFGTPEANAENVTLCLFVSQMPLERKRKRSSSVCRLGQW